MNVHSLVYPMFAMVLLTFGVLLTLFRMRSGFVRSGEADATHFKTYQVGSEPEASAKVSRHFSNLFESPTLFYVACLAAMIGGLTSPILDGLAWLYVALRCAHAYIHTGANTLTHRIAAYFSSWAVLLALWVCVVLGIGAPGS